MEFRTLCNLLVLVFMGGGCGLVAELHNPTAHDMLIDPAIGEGPDAGRRFGDIFGDQGRAVASDDAGNVYVTGTFGGTLELGDGATLTKTGEVGQVDTFVASFDATGAHRWSVRFGGEGSTWAESIALAGDMLAISGSLSGIASADGGTSIASEGQEDAFIAAFGVDGSPRWAHRFGGTGNDVAHAVATAADGFVIAGEFRDTIELAGAHTTAGDSDAFVASLGLDGSVRWSRTFGGGLIDGADAVAVATDGSVRAAGRFMGPIDLEGAMLDGDEFEQNAWAAAFSPEGATMWAHSLSGPQPEVVTSIDVDTSGTAWVTGSFNEGLSAGDLTLTSNGVSDGYVAMIDAAGTVVALDGYGGEGADQVGAISIDDTGAWLTGAFTDTLPIAATELESTGMTDIFLVRLTPDGAPSNAQRFGGEFFDRGVSVASSTGGGAWMTGWVMGPVDFSDDAFVEGESYAEDAFLLGVSP